MVKEPGKEVSDPLALVFVLEEMGQHENGIQWLKKAMKIWKKSLGDDHLDLAMCYHNMGIAYQEQRKYAEVLDSYRKSWSMIVFSPTRMLVYPMRFTI